MTCPVERLKKRYVLCVCKTNSAPCFRVECGLPPLPSNFDQINRPDELSADVWQRFSQLYAVPADIELFPGGLAETPAGGGILGPVFTCILGKQFENLKNGDRSVRDKMRRALKKP